MAPDESAPADPDFKTTLEQVLASTRVVEVARLLNIDLHDQRVRKQVLAQAKNNLATMAQPSAATSEDSTVSVLQTGTAMASRQVLHALESYRNIAAL